MNEIDVSIIISCYNGQYTILETLRSALSQKKVTVEIILVNDGSSDKSENVLRENGLLQKIIYLYQANEGVSVALNNGRNLATGKYITFLDHDDIIDELFCYKMKTMLEENNMVIGYCNYEYFHHEKPGKKSALSYPIYKGEVRGKIISEHFIPTTGAVMIKKSSIENIFFDPELKGPQDWLFWIEILMRYPICFFPEKLIKIRIKRNSLSRQSKLMSLQVLKLMEKVEKIVLANEKKLKPEDIAKFYLRYSSYLNTDRDFKNGIKKWIIGIKYNFNAVQNCRLFLRLVLVIFKVDKIAENYLWKRRENNY